MAQILYSNPGRPFPEQRTYSVSIVNGACLRRFSLSHSCPHARLIGPLGAGSSLSVHVNVPQAQIVCAEGYRGIPQDSAYQVLSRARVCVCVSQCDLSCKLSSPRCEQVILQCSCTLGLFGSVCHWNNFEEALAGIIENAGRDSHPQVRHNPPPTHLPPRSLSPQAH